MLIQAVRRGALVALLGVSLAACGTRSSLDSPSSDADKTATAQSGQVKREGEAPKPHRGFILDGLIR